MGRCSRGPGRPSPARKAALELVSLQRRRAARMRDLLRGSDVAAALSAQDRALASRLALGVVATRGLLDETIARHLSAGHLEPRVRDALEVSAFELLYLRTPAAVAASQGVELVRWVAPRAAGLANAVLHRIAEEDAPRVAAARAALMSSPEGFAADDAALAAGLPAWLIGRICSSIGPERTSALALSALDPAPIYVAANHALISDEALAEELAAAGLAPAAAGLAGAFLLERPQGLSASRLVQEAKAIPADLSAQLVAKVAVPSPGERCLEIGQGRGTKTLLLLNGRKMLEGKGVPAGPPLVCVESEPFKTKVSEERLAKGWQGSAVCLSLDGRLLAEAQKLPEELRGAFDTVFLDAPCSGTGTLRRHPEIAWSLAPEDLDRKRAGSLPELQLALLRAAATRVASGGRLVYATCSVLAEEDEDIVRAFLADAAGAGFEIVPASSAPGLGAAAGLVQRSLTDDGFFRSAPAAEGPDGHFCAVFRKVPA